MSTSTYKNRLAIENVKNAIKNLKSAASKIDSQNDNSQTDEIIRMINESIHFISGLEPKINGINSSISYNERIAKGDNNE